MIFQEELIRTLRIHGERTAIEQGEKRFSYAEILELANKIARFLLDKGVGRETAVGILLDNKFELISAMIGIAIARCVFVPIDRSLPYERIRSIIANLDLAYVISPGASPLPGSVKQYSLDEIVSAGASLSASFEYPEYHSNDALYIYFTSGSTGKPKGIIGKNCSLLQFIQWEISTFNLDAGSKVSQLISPYFDAFLRDIFVPLLAGGTICIPPEDDDFYSPAHMATWIDESRIALIHCVPSIFRVIQSDALTPGHFAALRYVLLSGEKIIPAELNHWYTLFGDRIQLVNLYGPTETTMVRSFYRIQPSDVRQTRMPVGSPIAGTEILISKGDLKPCDPLVSGEVYIVTPFASKGYLNDPELTHEKFIKPDKGKDGEVIAFKTGDIGRMLLNGQVDLIGREDRQIKMRGIRIEPEEIESILFESGYFRNAIVVPHSDNNNESLIAFVVRKDGLAEGINVESAVEEYIKERLPKYMIPSRIKEMNAFPLLSNGKINYKELLNELRVRKVVDPENEIEARVLGIWKEIVGDKQLSIDDDFNRVGGNSLAIMKLISLIYREFSIRMSLQDIFTNMTIKKQAEVIHIKISHTKILFNE